MAEGEFMAGASLLTASLAHPDPVVRTDGQRALAKGEDFTLAASQ
jgi:hypothetical protein